tara:strand:+ start:262 stop:978 length:717 start_codon:yes stop_codon:yes gene_type:complete
MAKLIAGNWKMNLSVNESIKLVEELKSQSFENDVAVIPPFTSLSSVSEILKKSDISLGAQNMHFEDSGAFTGEISPLMLKDIGCKYVLVGHSERRQIFGETDDLVNKKLKTAIKHGLIPILCIGETLEQREAKQQEEIIEAQIINALNGLKVNKKNIVIAYEPVWAIGTGKTATPDQAQEIHSFIRALLSDTKIRILYGGSVKPANASELLSQQDIDGALVGGAALKASDFSEIAKVF